MCLGIPAKIIERYEKEGTQMGKVDFGGVLREVCFETLPEADGRGIRHRSRWICHLLFE